MTEYEMYVTLPRETKTSNAEKKEAEKKDTHQSDNGTAGYLLMECSNIYTKMISRGCFPSKEEASNEMYRLMQNYLQSETGKKYDVGPEFELYIGKIEATATETAGTISYSNNNIIFWDIIEIPAVTISGIQIPLDESTDLFAKKVHADTEEIQVGIKKHGEYHQTLAVIHENYKVEEEFGVPYLVYCPGEYEVDVYGDPKNDSWTEKYQIPEYVEEDTMFDWSTSTAGDNKAYYFLEDGTEVVITKEVTRKENGEYRPLYTLRRYCNDPELATKKYGGMMGLVEENRGTGEYIQSILYQMMSVKE